MLFAHPNIRAECGLNNANQIWSGNKISGMSWTGTVFDCPKFNKDLKIFIKELKEKNFNYLVLSKKFITNSELNYEYIEIFDEIWENLIIIKLNDNNFLDQNPTKNKNFKIKKITPDKINIFLECLKIKCNQVLNIYPSSLLKIKDKNRDDINFKNLDNKITFSLDEGSSNYLIYYDKTVFNYFYVFSILSLIVIFRGKFL